MDFDKTLANLLFLRLGMHALHDLCSILHSGHSLTVWDALLFAGDDL